MHIKKILAPAVMLLALAGCALFPKYFNTNILDKIIELAGKQGLAMIYPPGSASVFPLLTLTGTAYDTNGLEGVYISLDGGPLERADGDNEWSRSYSLTEAAHQFAVYIKNMNGDYSESNVFIVNATSNIYVTTTGNDLGPGTNGDPVRTIEIGIKKAAEGHIPEVRVQVGTYLPGTGLNTAGSGINIDNISGIRLTGGWDVSFLTRFNYSDLEGSGILGHVISARAANNIVIDGFVIRGGYAWNVSDDNGGGIYFNNVNYSVITNCIISNNTAYGNGDYMSDVGTGIRDGNGGGIFIINSSHNYINATINNNISTNMLYDSMGGGAGIFIFNGYYNIIESLISNNQALRGGGGVAIYLGGNAQIKGVVCGNNNTDWGSGIYVISSEDNIINSLVINNSGGSGAIGIINGHNTTVSGMISNNNSGRGGGICIHGGAFLNISCYIINNNGGSGNGIYMEYINNNININNSIITNNYGDSSVIYLYNCSANGLTISSNCFGGTFSSADCAIFEAGSDVTGHILINNLFITNTLLYLYHDFYNGDALSNEIYKVNDPAYSGAAAAYGNIATNM